MPSGRPSADRGEHADAPALQRDEGVAEQRRAAERLGDQRGEAGDDVERRRQHARRHEAGDRGRQPPGEEQRADRGGAVERRLARRGDAGVAPRRGSAARRSCRHPGARPRRDPARHQVHGDREQRAERADDRHRHQQDAHLERARRVEGDVAEPGGGGEQLGRDQRGPGVAEGDARAGDERRQRGAADDARQDLPVARRRASARRGRAGRRSSRPPASSSSPTARWRR